MTTATEPTRPCIALASPEPPPPSEDVIKLLARWRVDLIGNGDELAGMNTLAGLCGVLANVAGPDAALVDKTGDRLPAGLDWTVAGDHSAGLLRAHGLQRLSARQTALIETLQNLGKLDRRREEIEGAKSAANRALSEELRTLDRKFGQRDGLLGVGTPIDMLLAHKREPMEEIKAAPLVFFEGSSPGTLAKTLGRCHLGHAFVSFCPADPAQFDDIAAAREAIAGGRQLENGGWIRGRSVVLTGVEAFGRHLRDNPGRHGLVLADVAPTPLIGRNDRDGPGIGKRFDRTLKDVLNRRFDYGAADALEEAQGGLPARPGPIVGVEWRAHLAAIRRAVPGDEFAAASRLFATLYFGLINLSVNGPGIRTDPAEAAALTVFLMRRSAFATREIRMAARSERTRRLADSVARCLTEGRHTARELCRRHNRLPIGECRQVLGLLADAGFVGADGPPENPATAFHLIAHNTSNQ